MNEYDQVEPAVTKPLSKCPLGPSVGFQLTNLFAGVRHDNEGTAEPPYSGGLQASFSQNWELKKFTYGDDMLATSVVYVEGV